MSKSYLRGHEIEYLNDEWVYSDTKESTAKTFKNRPCGNCGKFQTEKEHDACIADLPIIINACCGHGVKSKAYVQFYYGMSIHGDEALKIIKILKKIKK